MRTESLDIEVVNICSVENELVNINNVTKKTKKERKILNLKYKDPKKAFACEHCPYSCKNICTLNRHTEDNHGSGCFICKACSFTTKKVNLFTQHQKKKHGVKVRKSEATVFPIPPQPVLSMKEDQLKVWFPSFFSKLLLEIKESGDGDEEEWIKDVSEIISLNHLVTMGEDIFKEKDLLWKLKLVSAIVLDHKGIDYTEFGLEVIKKFSRYPVKELKMMSQAKNPATFEKMFETSEVFHPKPKLRKDRAKHRCDRCSFDTNFFMSLKKHKIQVHKGTQHTCNYCDFKAKDQDTLQSHRLNVHNPTSGSGFETLRLSSPPLHMVKTELG